MGPLVASCGRKLSAWGSDGTAPKLGRNPYVPVQPAGLRRDPIMSDPSAKASMPVAKATAAPPEEPPAVRDTSHGLRVGPKTGLVVWLPRPNSGVLVLPITIAPASRMRATMMSSAFAALAEANSGDPIVVTKPAAFARSLTAMGNP